MSSFDRYTWNVYLEEADSDDPAEFIGTVEAISGGEALQKASEYFEIPSYDLVVKNKEQESKEGGYQ